MIFNLLGTPTTEDIEELEREDAKRYIKCFAKRAGEKLAAKFPHVDVECLSMLEKMLQFNPKNRTRVTDALEQPLFDEIRDPRKETVASSYMTLEFEKEPDLDEDLLRKYFGQEMKRYQSEVSEL